MLEKYVFMRLAIQPLFNNKYESNGAKEVPHAINKMLGKDNFSCRKSQHNISYQKTPAIQKEFSQYGTLMVG